MSKIDREKISNLLTMARVFIDIDGVGQNLTEEQADSYAERAILVTGLSVSDEEKEEFKNSIYAMYRIHSNHGYLISNDYKEEKWYEKAKENIDPQFWARYRDYLIDVKKFNPNIVATLGEETLNQKIMNSLGNPDSVQSFLRRGLIIGDVQSGKTSTYIGLMCKAADAHYKVFILLTGTIESLRKQTQERVEEGFVGINLATEKRKNGDASKRVGVGLDNKPILAASLTSRGNDFTANCNKIAVSLDSNKAVVFVIKKNKAVLTSLTEWLINTNADPVTQKIDLPMIMIDDEADNASINTSKEKEDPTVINKLIRNLANVFTKSNYIGFTATPFANVFIDPETTEEMENSDLFPEDFICCLPSPSDYIGPTQIFDKDGKYHNQVNYIVDAGVEKADGWPFYYKHKKDWEDDLPNSLTDAIYTFYLANAIRDLRGDTDTHRSMMVNMSRFVKVQKYIKKEIEAIHKRAYSSIKFNLSNNFDESMKDPILKRIYLDWKRYYNGVEFSWEDIVSVLLSSVETIQIKVVNSSKSSEKLIYTADDPIRVIAVGGLALSRGLTLEGLIVSYFYRNTCTYDVLMQMGRWFGYRTRYDDLFRIWIKEESADWYAEIAEATEQLKMDMGRMQELELKPRDFGIRVRNDSEDLSITAANKMRNAVNEYQIESYFGNLVETPYLIYDAETQKNNYKKTVAWLEKQIATNQTLLEEKRGAGAHHVIYDVDKWEILEYLKDVQISKYSTQFSTSDIRTFLTECTDRSISKWNVIIMDGSKNVDSEMQIKLSDFTVYKVRRNSIIYDHDNKKTISLGGRGKIGGISDGVLGIIDRNGFTAEEIIENAKREFEKDWLQRNNCSVLPERIHYQSNTWFKFVEHRNPAIIIYFIDPSSKSHPEQSKEFSKALGGCPLVALAMGFPKNKNAPAYTKYRFKANKYYNWFEKDSILAESEEEE